MEKDPALERRFQPVMVGEPTKEETLQILFGLRDKYEAHHKVRISDEAINAAVELSDRYITDRYLPDKAIDLIDEAASRVRLQSITAPPDLKELEDKLEDLMKEKEEAVMNQNYEKAAKIRDEEQRIKEELEERKSNWSRHSTANSETVGEEEIAHIVASWTGIPVKKLTEGEAERLLNMEQILHNRIIGQNEAVKAVSRATPLMQSEGSQRPTAPLSSLVPPVGKLSCAGPWQKRW